MAHFHFSVVITPGSSNIHGIAYSPDAMLLRVQFMNKDGSAGKVYEYKNVPPEVAATLPRGSVGNNFQKSIRTGGYGYSIVESLSGDSPATKEIFDRGEWRSASFAWAPSEPEETVAEV